MKKNIFILILFFIVFGFILTLPGRITFRPVAPGEVKHVLIGGERVKVEIADTLAEQSQGLSGRKDLPEDEGLLFVFKNPGKHAFWMKDMKFPIDIVWIAEDMKVVHIEKSASPESFPNTFTPTAPALFVLEVPAGFADQHKVEVGGEVLFTKY